MPAAQNKKPRTNWRPFEEAKKEVYLRGFKTRKEFKKWCISGIKPDNIPSHPEKIYKNEGWKGWPDFLGYETWSFENARKYVHGLKLNGKEAWSKYCKSGKKPDYIPASPEKVYKNKGWKGWGDWLGTYTIAVFNRDFRPFENARKYVHGLKLKDRDDWYEHCRSGKKPDDIPALPSRTVQK